MVSLHCFALHLLPGQPILLSFTCSSLGLLQQCGSLTSMVLSTVATVTQNVSNAVFASDCFQLEAQREAVGCGEMFSELRVAESGFQLEVQGESKSHLKHFDSGLGH